MHYVHPILMEIKALNSNIKAKGKKTHFTGRTKTSPNYFMHGYVMKK